MKKIYDYKCIRLLFWTCFVAYFSTYLGRLNFNAVIVEAVAVGFLTKTMAGTISTASFFTYGVGQFISGFLADRFNPLYMMIIGLLGSAAANITMGFLQNPLIMPYIWGMNGFFQALTWCPIMRLFAELLSRKESVRANVNFSSCAVAGVFGAYILSSFVVYISGWKTVFFVSALIMVTASVIWKTGIGKVFKFAEENGVEEICEQKEVQQKQKGFFKTFVISGLIFSAVAVMLQGSLKDAVTTWAPSYLADNFGTLAYQSIFMSSVLPIINLIGVYLSAYINKKVFKNELLSAMFFFFVSALGSSALLFFRNTPLTAIALIGLITTSMYGVNTLTIGLMPLYFTKQGRAATVTGVMNSFTYMGCALSTFGISLISERFGWGATISVWIVSAVAGVVFCLIGSRRWGKFISDN